jgi:PAS domain S-box-containing protein
MGAATPRNSPDPNDEVFERLVDSLPVMVARYDASVSGLRINRHFVATLGWTEQDAAEHGIMNLCYPDPEVRRETEAFMARPDTGWREIPTRTKDGRTLNVMWTNIRLSHEVHVGIGIDVTALEEAKARAVDTERRLAVLGESLPQLVWWATATGRCEYVNERWRSYTGQSVEQAQGHGWVDAVPAEERQATLQRWISAVATGDTIEFQQRIRRHDGAHRWFLLRAFPTLDSSGNVLGWCGSCTDIEDLKAAQEAAEFERERLAVTIENAVQGISVFDASGRLVMANSARNRLMQLASEQDAGSLDQLAELFDVRLPDGRSLPQDEWPTTLALRGEMVRDLEVEMWRRRDGKLMYTGLYNAGPVRGPSGRIEQAVVTAHDVTARKASERALKASEERFSKAFAASPDPLVISGLDDGVIREVNASFLELFGASRDEIVGRRSLDLGLFADPTDRERALALLRSDGRIREFQVEIRTLAGDTRTALLTAEPLDLAGESALLTILRDVTELRRAAEALQRSEAQLLEADRRKDEFLAILAHELRNPLAPIRSAVRVLAHAGAGAAEQQWGRDVIERQIATMARLLDDLLDVSRITRGKLELRREQVALSAIIQRAVETARPMLENRRHELRVCVPSAPVILDADPVRLAQVIGNLLSNAAKYTPTGGRIGITATAGHDDVQIVVEDNGRGLAETEIGQIFDMFTQVGGSRSDEGGLGIGLALVKSLVEMHGGTVSAHSSGRGTGSTFVIRLPLADSETGRSSDGERRTVSSRRRRILVVDDNRDGADSLAMLLQLDGHDVRTAHSGQEALRIVEEFVPQFALLDIGMPGMNGYELAARLRGLHLEPRPALVAVTGWGQTADKAEATAAGFDHHLTKPVDLDQLSALLS